MSKKSYRQVLYEIEELRKAGAKNSDPKMLSLRIQLRDHLTERNKNSPQKIIPTLTAVKTIRLDPKTLGKTNFSSTAEPSSNITPNPSTTELATASEKEDPNSDLSGKYTEFYVLGMAIAVIGLTIKFLFFKED